MSSQRVLLVSATEFEVGPFLQHLGFIKPLSKELFGKPIPLSSHSLTLDLLITGVGQLQTASALSLALPFASANTKYDLVIQAGLCGSFTEKFGKCSVVRVSSENLADLGAEDPSSDFLDLFEMRLLDKGDAPFKNGELYPITGDPKLVASFSKLGEARSVTVNRVLSHERSISWVKQKFSAEVVNMEGGSLFFVCGHLQQPVIQIRAVSDMVGPRDKSQWDLVGGVQALNRELITWRSQF